MKNNTKVQGKKLKIELGKVNISASIDKRILTMLDTVSEEYGIKRSFLINIILSNYNEDKLEELIEQKLS